MASAAVISQICLPQSGSILLGVVGIALTAIAYLIAVLDPHNLIVKHTLSLREGSYAFGLWKKPPVPIYLRVYIFNVTNSEAFLRGEERLHLQEVGPFVYREEMENANPTFGTEADDSLTFEPRRTVHYEPDMSLGSLQDKIIVPNLSLVAIASLLHKSSIWTNLALSTLVNYLASRPFLQLSVEEYLWGYEEPLLSLASTFLPSWITFSTLGLLDRLYAMDSYNITIKDGRIDPNNIYKIEKVNGAANLGKWAWLDPPDPDEMDLYKACKMRDTIVGTYEGMLFPQNVGRNTSLRVYRDAMCRPLILQYQKDVTIGKDLPAIRFQPPLDFLNSTHPENACHCLKNKEKCLPDGLTDMSPCYFNFPIAVSYPHFYLADPRIQQNVLGMFPDEEKHQSFIDIQPVAGIPMQAHSRIQLNMIVKDTTQIRRAAPFKNLILPIVWTDLSLDQLPPSLMYVVHLLVVIVPIIQQSAIFGLSCAGGAMILACLLIHCYSWIEIRKKSIAHKSSKKWNQLVAISSNGKTTRYIPVEGNKLTACTINHNKLQEKLGHYIAAGYTHNSEDHLSGQPLLKTISMTKTCV
ncbi:scavenger receptor class B member 1-like [Hetaerina americana]|uniref:scavenger receptor class B member 1-like n=1 Tax=Hetaerina americana TaxID=62018 RepID=UPI003A7F5EB4